MVAMCPTFARTVSSSELSRKGGPVFRAAEEGPVEITRRDGVTLVLTSKTERERQFTALNLAADLVAASLAPNDKPFVDRLMDRFPWMTFLTPAGRQHFADEIVQSARACAAVHDFDPFLTELVAWRETAASKAEGFTPDDALDWFEVSESVPHPNA